MIRSSEAAPATQMPKATHVGKLFDGLVDCYVLDDERRVLSQRGVVRALTSDSASKTQLERFFDRMPDKYRHLAVPPVVAFRLPGGGLAKGREASWFVDLLKAYDEASDEGLLHTSQQHLALNARRIIRALAGVGLVALIDEATGYQQHRHPEALSFVYRAIIAEQMKDWTLLWGSDFVRAVCALHGERYVGGSHPAWMSSTYEKLYRLVLSPDVYAEIKRRNPEPHFGSNHHQLLTEAAREAIARQMPLIIGLARTSGSKDEFWARCEHHFSGRPLQLGLLAPVRQRQQPAHVN